MPSLLVFLWGLFATAGPAPRETLSYSQTYRIFVKGEAVGTESVSETSDAQGNLVSSGRHEVFVADGLEKKRMAFTTRLVLGAKDLAPVSYSCVYTSGEARDSYTVTVRNGRLERVLTRGGHTSSVKVPRPPDLVVIDFSVYHHYDYLIRRYDSRKGGRQEFRNFIPVIGAEVPLALTRLEDSQLEAAGVSIPVRNFRVEFVGILTGTLSTDRAGRLVRLLVPQQDLQVLREDLVPETPGGGSVQGSEGSSGSGTAAAACAARSRDRISR